MLDSPLLIVVLLIYCTHRHTSVPVLGMSIKTATKVARFDVKSWYPVVRKAHLYFLAGFRVSQFLACPWNIPTKVGYSHAKARNDG